MFFRDFTFGVLATSTIIFFCIICNKIPNVSIGEKAETKMPNITVNLPKESGEMITDGPTVPPSQWNKN